MYAIRSYYAPRTVTEDPDSRIVPPLLSVINHPGSCFSENQFHHHHVTLTSSPTANPLFSPLFLNQKKVFLCLQNKKLLFNDEKKVPVCPADGISYNFV